MQKACQPPTSSTWWALGCILLIRENLHLPNQCPHTMYLMADLGSCERPRQRLGGQAFFEGMRKWGGSAEGESDLERPGSASPVRSEPWRPPAPVCWEDGRSHTKRSAFSIAEHPLATPHTSSHRKALSWSLGQLASTLKTIIQEPIGNGVRRPPGTESHTACLPAVSKVGGVSSQARGWC